MVRKGEYLERAVVLPAERPIEGLFHRGPKSPGLLIAAPHPLEGGGMETTVIAELAWAVTRAGHPTLRFNYRGVGASQGTFTEEGAYRDLLAAADHLRACIAEGEEALPPIAAIGWGLGGNLVARLAIEAATWSGQRAAFAVSPLMLISPLLDQLPPGLASYRGNLVVFRSAEEEPAEVLHARLATVPDSDRRFLRGLVNLGKVVAETLSPRGFLDLSER